MIKTSLLLQNNLLSNQDWLWNIPSVVHFFLYGIIGIILVACGLFWGELEIKRIPVSEAVRAGLLGQRSRAILVAGLIFLGFFVSAISLSSDPSLPHLLAIIILLTFGIAVTWSDFTTLLIPHTLCHKVLWVPLAIALLGSRGAGRQLFTHLIFVSIAMLVLFIVLFIVFWFGVIGGGDVLLLPIILGILLAAVKIVNVDLAILVFLVLFVVFGTITAFITLSPAWTSLEEAEKTASLNEDDAVDGKDSRKISLITTNSPLAPVLVMAALFTLVFTPMSWWGVL